MIAFDPKKTLKEHEARAIAAIDEAAASAKWRLTHDLDRIRDAMDAVVAQAKTDPRAVVFAAIIPLNLRYNESFSYVSVRFGQCEAQGVISTGDEPPREIATGRYAVVVTLEKLPDLPEMETK